MKRVQKCIKSIMPMRMMPEYWEIHAGSWKAAYKYIVPDDTDNITEKTDILKGIVRRQGRKLPYICR